MKKRSIKLAGMILLVCVLAAFCFTSCGMYEMASSVLDIYKSALGEGGDGGDSLIDLPELTLPALDNENSSSGTLGGSGDTTQNTIIIEGATSNIAYAASAGARSAVSVYASFGAGTSAGSGVIYKLDVANGSAFIITNYHVVYYSNGYTESISEDIKIYLYGLEGEAYGIPATFVGGSPNYDIAILRIESNQILKNAAGKGSVAAVTIADSNNTTIGETAIAIGNPESSGISVTSGVVSVDSEYIKMTSINGEQQVEFRLVRIDTAINSGNSGGGLFNGKGELIGIVNAKITKSDVENIGYAIPSNIVRAVAENIIDNCYGKDCKTIMRAMLGITISVAELSTEYDTESGRIEKIEKISIEDINQEGIGYGKFQKDDTLKSIKLGDKVLEITRRHHVIDLMLDARAGDTVEFSIIRGGTEQTVTVIISTECLVAY